MKYVNTNRGNSAFLRNPSQNRVRSERVWVNCDTCGLAFSVVQHLPEGKICPLCYQDVKERENKYHRGTMPIHSHVSTTWDRARQENGLLWDAWRDKQTAIKV
jgi:hypothetical protein